MYKYAHFKEIKVRYSDQGKGRAIVFLHGFMENMEMWKDFSSQLSKSYRVICIDLPGFGETPVIGYIHTMEQMATCVKAVMDSLRLRRYILVGHSMGGYVSLAFAELFHDNVSGLCLFHSTAAADSEEKKVSRDKAIEVVKRKPHQYIQLFFEPLFAPQNVEKFKNEIEQFQLRASTLTPAAIVNALEGMKARKNMEWMLGMTDIPVGFIIGKLDFAIPFEQVVKQSTLAKHSKMLLLENVGHMGFLEAKDETLLFVRQFARSVFRKLI